MLLIDEIRNGLWRGHGPEWRCYVQAGSLMEAMRKLAALIGEMQVAATLTAPREGEER